MNKNSIEEDIKIVENYLANSAINEIESNFFKNGGWETVDLEIPKSMQHILSDYKRVLKENEELKNIDLTTVYLKGVADEKERWRNKIREKIEKLDIEISTCEYADDDSEEYKQEVEKNKAELLMAKKVLQQLLESEGKK